MNDEILSTNSETQLSPRFTRLVTASVPSKSRRLNGVLSILLILISAVILFYKLDAYPRLWFDEGYKLNAAYTVMQDGLYATYTVNGYVPFDPGTSGGPADILPTALALKLFGTSIFSARLTSVLYTLLAVFSLYQIGSYLWNDLAGLFCILLVIAVPPIDQVGLILMGRQSLSEAAALGLIVFGIWLLIRAWGRRSIKWGLLSGAVIGLGILSKSQLAIGLIPAMLGVAGWRWLRERKNLLTLFTPVVTAIVVFVIWMLVGRLFTPPDIGQQNSVLLLDAIKTNIFTTLFGRNLDARALLVICITLLGVVTSIWRISWEKDDTDQKWIELILVGFALFAVIWFTIFSIGWVRYSYAGMVIGLFLCGRFIWDIVAKIFTRWNHRELYVIVIVALVALGINFKVINDGEVAPDAQGAADYIATSIPKDAIIETWEWELDMLSLHRQYHHPPQSLLFEAIRQSSLHETFHLTYDPLKSNADYLIVGTFGQWTGIYDAVLSQKHFNEVATFGVYHIYKRVQES